MNANQLLIAALCLWVLIITVAYFREYIRHKRLRHDLDGLLARLTARGTPQAPNIIGLYTTPFFLAAQWLEELLNKED